MISNSTSTRRRKRIGHRKMQVKLHKMLDEVHRLHRILNQLLQNISSRSHNDATKSTTKQQSPNLNTGPDPKPGQIASLSRLPVWPPPNWRSTTAPTDSDPDEISPVNPHAQPYNRVQDVLEERRKTLERLRRPAPAQIPALNGQATHDRQTIEEAKPQES